MLPCIIHEAVNYFYMSSASIFLRKLFENQTLEIKNASQCSEKNLDHDVVNSTESSKGLFTHAR